MAAIVADRVEPVQVLGPLAHTVRMLWARGIGVNLVTVAQYAAALLGEDPLLCEGRRDLARRFHAALPPNS